MNPKFWSGKRVFLTGHTGFKGGWLSLWLQKLGVDLIGYGLNPPTQISLFQKANVGQGMRSIIGDIRDSAKLTSALCDAAPEIVIHMAAQPLVRESYIDPLETYSTNVMGTVHLFEAARQSESVRAVLNVTTDKCYENYGSLMPFRENDALGGYDPYSSSKACSELVTASYRNSYFNPLTYSQHKVALASARAGNVIGGGDWSEGRLVPDILAAFTLGEPVLIRSPLAVRPWQHVLEPLRGYLTLAEHLLGYGASFAEAFNFGPREEDVRPVEWIVNQLGSLWGGPAVWRLQPDQQPHEASQLRLDLSKTASRLGWRPELYLDDGLQLTVDWVRAALNGQDMHKFTLSQITAYQNRFGLSSNQ
jgi:CDP-glucose 4,6-dehydratase